MIPYVGFVGGTYAHPQSNINAEVCRNWVPERQNATAKAEWAYVQRPGLDAVVTAGVGPIRARLEQNGRYFVVSGPTLYELTEVAGVWSATVRGAINQLGDDGNMASMAGNGPQGGQILIVSRGAGFIYDLGAATLTQISDPQFPSTAIQVVFWKRHFVVIGRNGVTFSLSASDDGTSWATADIGEKSNSSDYIKTILVDEDSGELWLLGEHKTEVWWYNGALGFPAEPVPVLIPSGSAATFAWCLVGGSVYGLAQSREGGRVVMRAQGGYGLERISNHALDAALQRYSEAQIAQTVAFSFEWHGHRFFGLSIDDDDTWIYDEASDLWTQWDFWNEGAAVAEAFLGRCHLYANGRHLLGSRRDGTIYHCSEDYTSDDGAVIRRVRRAPYISANGKRVRHDAITFDHQLGVGDGTTTNPVCMVRWSDSQAKTWGPEFAIELGAAGAFAGRAQLRRLGLAGFSGRVYEHVVTDPVITSLTGAYLDLGSPA